MQNTYTSLIMHYKGCPKKRLIAISGNRWGILSAKDSQIYFTSFFWKKDFNNQNTYRDLRLQITNWTSKNRFANLYNTIFSICYTWKHYQTLFLGQPLNDASWIMQYAMYHALCIMYHALCIMHHKNRSCITHHIISLCTFWIFPILHIYFLFPLLPSSAQAPAQLWLSWLYFQLIQPPTPTHSPGKVFSKLQLTKYI